MKKAIKASMRSFLAELGIYGVLIGLYYLLVLHWLGGWLHALFAHNRSLYAVMALGLILVQGLVLEMLTRWVLGLFRGRRGGE